MEEQVGPLVPGLEAVQMLLAPFAVVAVFGAATMATEGLVEGVGWRLQGVGWRLQGVVQLGPGCPLQACA